MKVYIDSDEHYPVYTVADDWRFHFVEATAEQVEGWNRAMEEYEKVQNEISGILQSEPKKRGDQ